jgi:hypothetical protein
MLPDGHSDWGKQSQFLANPMALSPLFSSAVGALEQKKSKFSNPISAALPLRLRLCKGDEAGAAESQVVKRGPGLNCWRVKPIFRLFNPGTALLCVSIGVFERKNRGFFAERSQFSAAL